MADFNISPGLHAPYVANRGPLNMVPAAIGFMLGLRAFCSKELGLLGGWLFGLVGITACDRPGVHGASHFLPSFRRRNIDTCSG